MDRPQSKRSRLNQKKRQAKDRARKAESRLPYEPEQPRRKFTRQLRNNLKSKTLAANTSSHMQEEFLHFGSFNIQGLDLDAFTAVQDILEEKRFDVG